MKFSLKLLFIIIFFVVIKIINATFKNSIVSNEILKECLKCDKKKNNNTSCKKCPATEILNNLKILTPDETLNEIIFNNKSIARYGDVEFDLIFGIDKKGFQNSNKNISEKLREVLYKSEKNLLIGLPNGFNENYRNLYVEDSKRFWEKWTNKNKYKLVNLIDFNKTFRSTDISRFYSKYKDRSHISEYIKKLKMVWDNKDIVMIEGEKTRLGLGNDLFNNTKSIQRILCPNSNAYDLYDKIYNEAIRINKEKLIILALGPTATILAYDLNKIGYQVIDVGHVDIEYEWYLRKAKYKMKIENKHIYEIKDGTIIDNNVHDENYNKQIIVKISN